MFLDRDVWKREGPGEGFDNRARGNNLGLVNQIEMGAYHPPSHSKGCGKLWWEGGRDGVGNG